ncbi:MAG TPA: TetR family transcriptional regulator, partial [Acidimicrobiales bacterium]
MTRRAPPAPPARSARAAEVVAAARIVLERDGAGGLTMQSVADELHIKAPSLYKHVAGKRAIEVELVADALAEMGEALHATLAGSSDGDRRGHRAGGSRPLAGLLAA